MNHDDAPCRKGYDKRPFGRWHCDSWYCPRCHRVKRAYYANLLLTDFRHRTTEWFRQLHFAVFRPCRLIQAAPLATGVNLALAILKRFHKLLRDRTGYTHFSVTEDTSLDERTGRFDPDIHTHALMWGGGLTKAMVRSLYVQAHEHVLGADNLGDEDRRNITVYFRPCRRPFRAALYVVKHGRKYAGKAREFRSVDSSGVGRNPVRVGYIRSGKGVGFFSKPVGELTAEVAQRRTEYRKRQIEARSGWAPSSEELPNRRVTEVIGPEPDPAHRRDTPTKVMKNWQFLGRPPVRYIRLGLNARGRHWRDERPRWTILPVPVVLIRVRTSQVTTGCRSPPIAVQAAGQRQL